jgi:hypothetical protein
MADADGADWPPNASSRDMIAAIMRQARRQGIPADRVVLHREAGRGVSYHTMTGKPAEVDGHYAAFTDGRVYRLPEAARPALEAQHADRWPLGDFPPTHASGQCETCDVRRRNNRITDTEQEKPMDRLEVIEARLAELEEQAASLRAIPDLRTMEDETTLSYERSYQGGDPFAPWYVFVAVKMAGRWHTSGSQGGERLDDDALRSLLASANVRNIFKASAWEPVAKVVATDEAGQPAEES